MGKIVGINLLIFAGYAILSGLSFKATEGMLLIGGYLLHCAICFILSIVNFVQGKQQQGIGFLLSTFLIGIIGFGTCFIMFFSGGGLNI
jgi:hypothetical protein